jgi:hypothetical protein
MRTMITWLGFRHVKYGVRPHHIPIMGQVPINSLSLSLSYQATATKQNNTAYLVKPPPPHPSTIASLQVLMAVLEKALAGQWTESMANAWSELWQVERYARLTVSEIGSNAKLDASQEFDKTKEYWGVARGRPIRWRTVKAI